MGVLDFLSDAISVAEKRAVSLGIRALIVVRVRIHGGGWISLERWLNPKGEPGLKHPKADWKLEDEARGKMEALCRKPEVVFCVTAAGGTEEQNGQLEAAAIRHLFRN